MWWHIPYYYFVVFFIYEKGQVGSKKEQQERQGTDQQSMSLKSLCNEICSPGNNEENRGSSLLHKSERHTLCLKSEICLGGHLSTGVDNED